MSKIYRGWLVSVVALLGLIATNASAHTVVRYMHTDALGSVVAVTDASGNLLESRRDYEPYGYQSTPALQDGPGYTGHVQDATTGLTYMQQRYYDSEIGRTLSVDPVSAYSSGDMRHFNVYAYAHDNPYRFTDPDGRISKEMKRQGFEEIGDGFVVRVDQFRGSGGEAGFEVHVYRDGKALEKAVEGGDLKGVRSAEVNTLKSNGEWGKHGKSADAPDLGKNGQAGFDKVVQREVNSRGWTVKKPGGRLELRDDVRRNLGKYSRFLGPAGAFLEYTRSSVDRACEISSSSEICP